MCKNLTKWKICNRIERFENVWKWYTGSNNASVQFFWKCETFFVYFRHKDYKRKVEVEKMAKEMDLKKIISNLAKLGVSATMTKSRLEMLKALAPPVHDPQIQSQS